MARLAAVKQAQREVIAARQEAIDERKRAAPIEIEFRGPTVTRRFPALHAAMDHTALTWPDPDRVIRAVDGLRMGGIVALVGPRGTGKTQLACWLSKVCCLDAVYMRADDLCGHLKAWLSLSTQDRNHNMMVLRRCPLLVIDEFQDRLRTEFEDVAITSIIDKRYGENLPTILIANVKATELVSHVGASIASRMTEGGALIVCDWPSFRGGAAKGAAT